MLSNNKILLHRAKTKESQVKQTAVHRLRRRKTHTKLTLADSWREFPFLSEFRLALAPSCLAAPLVVV